MERAEQAILSLDQDDPGEPGLQLGVVPPQHHLKELGERNEYPKPPDNFRWRFFGLFYVAPNQNSYMCRLRTPNGILKAAQFAGVAA